MKESAHPPRIFSLFQTISVGLLMIILLGGCVPGFFTEGQGSGPDPLFIGFYQSLGGEELFGPVISPLFLYNGDQCQYVQAALLCYHEDAPPDQQFILFPLGGMLGILIDPSADSPQAPIYDEFLPLYQQLGARLVGQPITAARVDYLASRIEQYFDNLGFYRNLEDPNGELRLLPYGSFACDRNCDLDADPTFDPHRLTGYAQPFLTQIAHLDAVEAFGQPLTAPYTNANGEWEQIYSNVVLIAPVGAPQSLRLYPLGQELGGMAEEPVADVGEQPGLFFFPSGNGTGYYIPLVFKTFIDQHGGMLVAGEPISGVVEISTGVFRQCFTNYCLDYDNTAIAGLVRITGLGDDYLALTQPALVDVTAAANDEEFDGVPAPEVGNVIDVASTQIQSLLPNNLILMVEEAYPTLQRGETQSIALTILDADNQQPVAGVVASLIVQYPDGGQYALDFPPTNASGVAVVTVPPYTGAVNATVIPYQACTATGTGTSTCARNGYLIWNFGQ